MCGRAYASVAWRLPAALARASEWRAGFVRTPLLADDY
jgi:hypothetical protein